MAHRRPHEQLLELSGEPVTLHEVTLGGPDGRYVGASEAACRLLGYARDELLRLTPRDLAAPGQALFGPGDADALLGGGVPTRTAQLRTRDGRIVSVEARSAVVEDAQGRTLAMSVLRDLAPRREPTMGSRGTCRCSTWPRTPSSSPARDTGSSSGTRAPR